MRSDVLFSFIYPAPFQNNPTYRRYPFVDRSAIIGLPGIKYLCPYLNINPMERHIEHRKHSGSFLAYVLIIFGILWILKRSGWDINLPGLSIFFELISNLPHWISGMALPLLVILIGAVLLVGRKFIGALLLVLLLLIVVPNFLIIPGILMILFIPLFLIIIGIILLSSLF